MKSILVIDDDVDILEALSYMLDASGYKTFTDTGNSDILEKIKESEPNIILLDILLSGKDGREICRTLKSSNNTKRIPIILISAHAEAANSVNDCNADDFIAKPFEMDILINTINKNIEKESNSTLHTAR